MKPRALAMLASALVLGASLSGCLQGGLVGKPAPAFELVTSTGDRVNQSSFLGKFVILDLMATWCAPCQLEVQHLKDVQLAYGDRVAILSIGADPTESDAQLDRFARAHGAAWPHGLDHDGSIGRAYHLGIIPKLVILDPTGNVVLEREGEVLPAAIASIVAPAGTPPLQGGSEIWGGALVALLGGLLAAFHPYRRYHRDRGALAPAFYALAALALLAFLAWRAADLVSTRATYGSLAIGAVTLGAVAWWIARARRQEAKPLPGGAAWEAWDRAYEAAPAFALAIVLGLSTVGPLGYAAVMLSFAAGWSAGALLRRAVPPEATVVPGVAGLLLVGLGLLVFGARILVAQAT